MIIFLSIALMLAVIALLIKGCKPGAVVCAVLIVILAVARPFFIPSPADRHAHFQHTNQRIMTEVFAEKVVARHPGKRIALIVNPKSAAFPEALEPKDGMESKLIEAFKQRRVEPILIPLPLRGHVAGTEASEETEFSSEMAFFTAKMGALSGYSAEDLNGLLLSLKGDADVVIWTLGLANTLYADKLLARGQGPELILMKVHVDDLDDALQSTVLDMSLTYKPNVSWETDYKWPKNKEEAFEYRYAVATRENSSN